MTDDLLLGQELDEYRLEALLGRGGMARVYRGLDVRLQRYAAIKVIDTPFRADSEYVRRFEREAQAIARLEHPHIVRLYRYGEAHGVLYMAMQYIEGSDLGSVLDAYHADQEFISLEDTSRIIREICLALDYAHSKSVIHRDIKPSNIMLDHQGQAYVTDFGLALLTETGTRGEVFGSPRYIAPEQAISSAGAVPQSDLYAVGIILYEMLTGHWPFDAENPMDLAMLHITEQPQPPRQLRSEISPELEAVILKAIAKEPGDRYSSGAALAGALDRAVKGEVAASITTRPHQSIPDRIALDMAQSPLPPLLGVNASHQPSRRTLHSLSTFGPDERTPAQGSRRSIFAGAAIGLVVGLALLGVMLLLVLRGGGAGENSVILATETETEEVTLLALAAVSPSQTATSTGTPTLAPTATPTASLAAMLTYTPTWIATSTATHTASPTASHTPTLPPTVTPAPTLTPVPPSATRTTVPPSATPSRTPRPKTATPSPAPAAASYGILIATQGEDSLFVANWGKVPFPLTPLRLGEGDGAINGEEWGVPVLSPGECVTAWKEGKNPKPPAVTCREVGPRLTRKPKERFWKSAFGVTYNGAWIANCDSELCAFSIPVEPQAAAAAPATEFELLIAKQGEDSLFVINQGDRAFPLAPLHLGAENGSIDGSEWGISVLQPGQCVTAWKNTGKKQKVPDVTCEQVGAQLTREGRERFWKSSFDIFYGGNSHGRCDSDRCTISIRVQ
jgi:serine/threonine protein kinase